MNRVPDEHRPDEAHPIDTVEGDNGVLDEADDRSLRKTERERKDELAVRQSATIARLTGIFLVHVERVYVTGHSGIIRDVRLGHGTTVRPKSLINNEIIEELQSGGSIRACGHVD
jgi:hypothetical protein